MSAVGAVSAPARVAAGSNPAPMLEVVIPVHNEETTLERSVRAVAAHLASLPWPARVSIADNASTDATAAIADRLAAELEGVRAVHLGEKGRGRALRRVWSESDARVLAYMDVDLSTDLRALLPLVAPLISGHSDLAIGSRLAPASRVERGLQREVISRGYNLILRRALRVGFSDAQCGFKAIRAEAAAALLPWVEDQGWFFDTELLTLAERAGLRIHEVPVDWVDDPDSRVQILRTALDDLRGVARIGIALARGRLPLRELGERLGRVSAQTGTGRIGLQAAMFALVGIASTLAYAALYLGLRHLLPALAANVTALLATAIANTAANRRFSFGVRGPEHRGRHHLQGLALFGIGVAVTSAVILAVPADAGRVAEVSALTAANLMVTVGRFAAMRWWIFRRAGGTGRRGAQGSVSAAARSPEAPRPAGSPAPLG